MATTQEKHRNPAEAKLELPKGYRPLASKALSLEVPELPGYTLHWFSSRDPRRIPDAQRAGWEFVNEDDGIDTNSFDIAGDDKAGGSTDLGTRISVGGGGYGQGNRVGRLYLMKCKNELVALDQRFRSEQSDQVAQAIKGGQIGANESGGDRINRYIDKARTSSTLFDKKS